MPQDAEKSEQNLQMVVSGLQSAQETHWLVMSLGFSTALVHTTAENNVGFNVIKNVHLHFYKERM